MPDPSPQLIALLEAVGDVFDDFYCRPDGDWVQVDRDAFDGLCKAFIAYQAHHTAAPEGDPPDWSAA
jgi:hypothetical protein